MNQINKACPYLNTTICSDIQEYQKGETSPKFQQLLDKYVEICNQRGKRCTFKVRYEALDKAGKSQEDGGFSGVEKTLKSMGGNQ